MPNPKETAEVDIGGQKVTLVRGDTPQEEWDTRLAKLAAKGVKAVKEAVPQAIDQTLRASPVGPLYNLAESSGKLMNAAKGQPTSNPLENVGTAVTGAVTTAGDVTGAATGLGKEIVGQVQENPQMVVEGKAQLQKNISDLTGQPETPPPPPAYPGPEPVETPPPAEQPSAALPTSQAAPAQRPALPKDFVKQQDDLTQAYNAVGSSAAAAKKAIDAGTEARTAALHEEERLNQEAEIIRLQRAQVQADIMAKAQQQRSEWMDRQNQLVELSRKAAEDPIDPNRYWNNKDVGQKVSAVIAGALFGFTGQGMQWLQRLDSLVAQDMQAQSADRASKVAGLERAAARAGSIADSAMKMGAEEAEARTLDKIAKMENIKARIDMLGRSSNNADVAAKAEMMKNQLDEKTLDSRMQLEKLREAKLARMAENDMRRAQLGMMAARQGAAGVNAGGKPLDAGQEEDMSSLLQAGDTISTAWNTYQKMAGGTGSSIKALGPAGLSDAASWDKDIRAQFSRRVGKTLENRMTDADAASYGAHFLPKSTSSKEEAKNVMRGSVVDAIQKYTNRYNTLAASGRDVSRLPTPQMYEAKIRSQTADILGSSIPAGAMEEVQ